MVRESRIRSVSIEAINHGAISLAQAFPDYAPQQPFIEAVLQATARADSHQYTDPAGTREARTAIASYIKRFHPAADVDPDANVLITLGAMEAMNDALFVALDPGDEAVVIEPYYECFVAQILSRHGVPRYARLTLGPGGRWALDIEAVERAFTSRTRALLLNTPGNPSGKVYTHAEIEALLELCQRHGAWLISDETYDQIYFTAERPASVIDVDPSLSQSVLLGGLGKTFGITGWRAGYLLGNDEFMRRAKPIHDVTTVCAVSMVQAAIPALVSAPDSYFSELRDQYRRRFEILYAGLRSCGFGVHEVDGAYYFMAEIPEWWKGTAASLNTALLERGLVAGVPGEVFYGGEGGERLMRYTFCKKEESLRAAVGRLQEGMAALRTSGSTG